MVAAVDFNQLPTPPQGPASRRQLLPPDPNSPCIGICNIGPLGLCSGCYRTLDEIAGWLRLDAEAQWAVLRACVARRRGTEPARRAERA